MHTLASTEHGPVVHAAAMAEGYKVALHHRSTRFTRKYEGRATNSQLLSAA